MMSKNEMICLYAATQFSKKELIELMAKQSYKLSNTKSANHTHRYATPHRYAKKDRKLKTEHTINKRLHLIYVFQNELEKKGNYHLLDAIAGMKIDKTDVFSYINCDTTRPLKIEQDDIKSSFYDFVGKEKSAIAALCDNKNLDKHSEAVYITNILKNIGGRKNDKKRINCYN
ncbi:MAG: hypothetical protein ACRC0G_12460 [Fusobacteriaceae bacterium]